MSMIRLSTELVDDAGVDIIPYGTTKTPIARIMSMSNNREGFLMVTEVDQTQAEPDGRITCYKCGKRGVGQLHLSICAGISGDPMSGRAFVASPGLSLIVVPNIHGREVGYIAGPSGSGKTTFVVEYIKEYMLMYYRRNIVIFTGIGEDDRSFDPIKGNDLVTFVPLDATVLERNPSLGDFAKTLVVFDDVSACTDKRIISKCDEIRRMLINGGRHNDTSVLVTNHLECEFTDKGLKNVVQESHFVVIFPRNGSPNGISRLLGTYGNIDKADVKTIMSMDARWLYLHKQAPKYILTERSAELLPLKGVQRR